MVFPSEIMYILGVQAAYGAQKRESGLSAVSLRPCGPLALIPVNGKKNEIKRKIRTKDDCSARPWGRRVVTLVSESCFLVDHTGHSASALRDSAVYLRKYFFLNMTPQKTPKQKRTFHGVSRHFRTFKVPTKLDGRKPS